MIDDDPMYADATLRCVVCALTLGHETRRW